MEAENVELSLFERLGGTPAIEAVVAEFYNRVPVDPLLAPFFVGVDLSVLNSQQIAFFTQALGGPKIYKGADMKSAHAHLKIKEAHFNKVAMHLVETLQYFAVPQSFIDEVIAAVAPLAKEIIQPEENENEKENVMNESTPKPPAPKIPTPSTRPVPPPSSSANPGADLAELKAVVAAINKVQAVIEFKLDGTIVHANENFLGALGYTLEEVKGKHHRIFVERSYAESQEYKDFWKLLGEGKFQSAEYKRIGKGGKEVWIQASYNPIFGDDGKPYKVVKFATDITESINLRFEQRGILNAISRAQAMIEFKLDGTIVTANENFLGALGYTLDEVKGKHHRIFVEKAYAESQDYKDFWRILGEGNFQTAEYKRIGKAGNDVWIQASYNPIFDADGKPYKVVKFATDITEAYKQRVINVRYASMTESSPANIMFADKDLFLRYINPTSKSTLKKLEHLLPAKVDELIGKNIDIFHKDPSYQRGILADPVKNLPRKAHIRVGPETLDLLVSPIYDDKKQFLGSMVTWEVITERLAAEEREKELTINLKKTMDIVSKNSQALSSAAEELSTVAQQMSSNSEETSVQANTVAAATEQVTKSVETVASSSEEMSASVKEIAGNAAQASKVATEAVRVAEETNKTISELGKSSTEIGKVIKVITSIAQQTNLLALNATIEAARAGEAGKGFAVVANEVKELAKQTAAATEDISQKIEAIQGNTKGAVDAISQISQVIAQINSIQATIASAVEEQSATTREIARNASEAAKGTQDISKNISSVSIAAKSTTEGASNTLMAATELSRLASELMKVVNESGVTKK